MRDNLVSPTAKPTQGNQLAPPKHSFRTPVFLNWATPCVTHMCSDVCVWVTIWHGEVLCAVCENRQVRHATHPLLPLGSSTQLGFVPPVPYRLCACLVAADHPPGVGLSVCGLGLVTRLVTIVGCTRELWLCWWPGTPLVGWSSWCALPVLPVDQLFFPNVALQPAFGQDSHAVFLGA